MQRLGPILAVLAITALVACPRPPEAPVEEPAGSNAIVPAGAVDPGPAPTPEPEPVGICLSDDDCPRGTCEGQGCGDDEPGTCTDPARMCTRDAQVYCGCDGEMFRGSGSCPGRRYDHRGEC